MKTLMTAMMLSTAMVGASPAMAQDSAQDAKIDALIAEVEALRAELAAVKAQVDAQDTPQLQQSPALEAEWKGSPNLKGDGFSFKPRGRLVYDVGTVEAPAGVADDGLGFGSELRRGRIGAQGEVGGGFGYKVEVDFADNDVALTDAYIEYGKGPLGVIVGQHNNFQSLEELTSDLHTSFIERAAFTDAFGFDRRVGASAQYSVGDVIAQAGVFTGGIGELTDDGFDARSVDGRLVFAPKMGTNQLHLGGSVHFRDLGRGISSVRYRQRPGIHITDARFLNTDTIDATSETGYGVEAAGVFGRFHVAGEGYWQRVARPASPNPTFFGGYVEAGYFLTDDTRGYKGGNFDRVKPSKAVGEGGIGSIQLNARYDYLDLTDVGIVGGTQNGYQASILWKPVDYVLFGLNYGHLVYDDAAIPAAGGDTSYSIDMVGLRSQVDF